jgi:hypothetical protein
MAQDVEAILAGAKKTLGEAEQKFPSPPMPQPQKPSYSMVLPARKAEAGIGAELKAKGEMVQKGREALK